jgi:hypothetical protein
MDLMDTRLTALRDTPPPVFAAKLRDHLRAVDRAAAPRAWRTTGRSLRSALAPAAIATVIGVLMTMPAVRASAAAFLARFRVVNFVAVPVDPSRFAALGSDHFDLGRLIGEHVQVVKPGGAPVDVASVDEAAAAAGMDVRLPAWLPDNTTIIQTAVAGARELRVTGNAGRLRQVLDALGISDVSVPDAIDGQTATIAVPPVVMIRFDHGGRRTRFFQAAPPEVTLPAGIDVKALGEIGLRILGLSSDEARRFADVIDWESTLMVPVPPFARDFKEIDINGHRGVLIAYQAPEESPTTMVLWSTDDRVYGMVSIQGVNDVLSMANSVP